MNCKHFGFDAYCTCDANRKLVCPCTDNNERNCNDFAHRISPTRDLEHALIQVIELLQPKDKELVKQLIIIKNELLKMQARR